MRLATIRVVDGTRAVVLRDDGVAVIDGYADIGALLREGRDGVDAARRAESRGGVRHSTNPGFCARC
jgi:hypothetical protein